MKKIKKIISNIANWDPSTYATIILLCLPILCYIVVDYKLNNDFTFLINVGKYITNNGFPNVEPFTIHEGLCYMPQQWLASVIFYLIYNNFGITGMLVLTIIVNFIVVFLIYQISLLISKRKIVAILVTIAANIFLFFSDSIASRPQMFDVVLILSEILLLEKFILKNEKKYLYFLPLISMLFINLHASTWLMLFVFMLPYYVEYGYKKITKGKTFNIKPLLIITILSFVAGIINPYHIEAITYLFKSYGVKEINSFVTEMKSININSDFSLYFQIFLAMYLIYKNKGKNTVRFILILLGTTYLMLSHARGVMFFEIALVLIVSDTFKNVENNNEKKVNITRNDKIIYTGMLIAILVICFCNLKTKEQHILSPFVTYLDKHATKNIRLYTGYNEGGYFEYKGYKCYIDPRAEVFLKSNNKKEDIFIEYYNLNTYQIKASKFLEKYNFDYLVVDNLNMAITNELKENKNYKLVKEIKYIKNKKKLEYYLYKNINKQ